MGEAPTQSARGNPVQSGAHSNTDQLNITTRGRPGGAAPWLGRGDSASQDTRNAKGSRSPRARAIYMWTLRELIRTRVRRAQPDIGGLGVVPHRRNAERPGSRVPRTRAVQSGAEGNRTPDLLDANETRYQLCYSPLVRQEAYQLPANRLRGVPTRRRRDGRAGRRAGRVRRRSGRRRRSRRRRCRAGGAGGRPGGPGWPGGLVGRRSGRLRGSRVRRRSRCCPGGRRLLLLRRRDGRCGVAGCRLRCGPGGAGS